MIVTRECDNPKGGVSSIRKVSQLMERCEWEGVKTFRRCDTPQGSERCLKGMSYDGEV